MQGLVHLSRRALKPSLQSSSRLFSSQKDWVLFPREKEGNVYSDNWPLTNDGVTPVGSAFRNARQELLLSRLTVKAESDGRTFKVPSINYTSGTFKILEAGDNITQDAYTDVFEALTGKFSSGIDLFVEDAAVVSHFQERVGVRVVTDKPALALIARSLLIPVPPFEAIPIARCDGWKHDPRYSHPALVEKQWEGTHYTMSRTPMEPGKGQRPIVAYYGGAGGDVTIQFIEVKGKISGANIVIGEKAPVQALVDAITLTSSVVVNELSAGGVALPSTVLVNGGKSVLVVGDDKSLLEPAYERKVLYGAYSNLWSEQFLSACWNGAILNATSAQEDPESSPILFSNDKAVAQIRPDNATFAPSQVLFVSGENKSLTEEEAVQKLVQLTNENKTALLKKLVAGKKLQSIAKASDALSSL